MSSSRAQGGPLESALELRGIGVSAGVAMGSALVLCDSDEQTVLKRAIPQRMIKQEVSRLEQAFEEAKEELQRFKEEVEREVGSERARIFEAQIYMLADDALMGESMRTVEQERVGAEWALRETRDRVIARFKQLGEEYFRDRLYDVKDVTRRVARKLSGASESDKTSGADIVIVSAEITPSEAATVDTDRVRAFIIEAGGGTSHTAILAKSLGIPAVVGVAEATQRIQTGDSLLVDGAHGVVVIRPTSAEIRDYQRHERTRLKHEKLLRRERSKASKTLDGRKVFLQANIERPEEVGAAQAAGAEGIGLYRTEFLYLSQKDGREPTEEEHFDVYRSIVKRVNPHSAIIRTLDLGGEKLTRPPGTPAEPRGTLSGLRAIRLCLAQPELFRVQLRALLRASAYGRLKVMFPFVSSVEEVREAKATLRECKVELRRKGQSFNDAMEVGAMIEVPAAAMTADLIAKEVSFFSIGTNDLIQYLLAVNRTDERVAHLYEPLHPATLRTIRHVIQSAKESGVRVGMCGEMAGDPLLTPLLVGLGLDELSMDPKSLPAVKYILRSLRYDECHQLAQDALAMNHSAKVKELLFACLGRKVPPWLFAEAPEAYRAHDAIPPEKSSGKH